jgi:hypothetical protein
MPESWRFDGRRLQPLILNEGHYQPVHSSIAFPFLPVVEFERFLFRLEPENQTKVIDDFPAWIRTLKVS